MKRHCPRVAQAVTGRKTRPADRKHQAHVARTTPGPQRARSYALWYIALSMHQSLLTTMSGLLSLSHLINTICEPATAARDARSVYRAS